ncbi:Isoflavone reductase [Paramyrothecium foliicola]|nr:Isoflavone reductase [Paramyrothecium foliicola]
MSAIKKVAVIGASGNFGPAIINSIQKAGFDVTAVSRIGSNATFPEGIPVRRVDFKSGDDLKSAFTGQDAVVSVVGAPAFADQPTMIDAALAAGVKRFLPSEYGGRLDGPDVETTGFGKMVASKIRTLEYLKRKAQVHPEFTWTAIATGLGLDFCLPTGAIAFNKDNKSATIYDSGDERIQAVSIAFIGETVAAVLRNPEQTANRYINVVEFETSANELLQLVESASGAKWTVTRSTSVEEEKIGQEKLAQGDYSAFVNFLRSYFLADGSGRAPKEDQYNNEELGLHRGDLRAFINNWINA